MPFYILPAENELCDKDHAAADSGNLKKACLEPGEDYSNDEGYDAGDGTLSGVYDGGESHDGEGYVGTIVQE